MNRLRLIWLALTASAAVVEDRVQAMSTAQDIEFMTQTRRALDKIKPAEWQLTGVRVEHYGGVDSSAIQAFLAAAPDTIRRLLDTLEPCNPDTVENMEASLSAIGDLLVDMRQMPAYERDFAIQVQLPDLVGDFMPQVRNAYSDDIPF